MSDTTGPDDMKCRWCGFVHILPGVCPKVKALDFYPDGSVKRVEFHSAPVPLGMTVQMPGGPPTSIGFEPATSNGPIIDAAMGVVSHIL